jgi:hypothetical protein
MSKICSISIGTQYYETQGLNKGLPAERTKPPFPLHRFPVLKIYYYYSQGQTDYLF